MTNQTRRDKENDSMKKKILVAARQIIAKEGFEKVSIRKIANQIEYSPSVIYHYFTDKDEILDAAMREGYQRITDAISSVVPKNLEPIELLKKMTRRYVEAAVAMSDEFLMAQFRPTPKARKYTASLFQGAATQKPALGILCNCLKQMHPDIDNDEIEIRAQLITTSTLGLILKLIVESDIGDEQRQRLIDSFCDDVVVRIAG